MLNSPSLGPTNTIADAQRNFEVIRTFMGQLMTILEGVQSGPATGKNLVLLDPEGNLQSYQLVDGSGVTITIDDVNKTWTITAP